MAATAFTGPLVVYGSRNPPAYGAGGSNTGSVSPTALIGGDLLLDPRVGYNTRISGAIGIGSALRRTSYIAPAALGGAKISALANAVSGTPVTLAGASTGVTVQAAAAIVFGGGSIIPAGALVLDGFPTLINFGMVANAQGQYNGVQAYNPTLNSARAVSITGSTSGTGGNFTVRGFDVYGQAMTETIAATAGATTVNGKKAWKFITSVTPGFSDAHQYSVGTTDIFGLPLRANNFSELLLNWNNALITANTGFVAADATAVSATTGDVRGTYAVQSASDGTKALAIFQTPVLSTLVTAAGMFGLVNFSG